MRKSLLASSVAALLLSANLCAQGTPPPPPPQPSDADAPADAPQAPDSSGQAASDPRMARAQAFLAALHFQQGDIEVPGADARFHLGQEFRYLDKTDADKVLEQFWRNPHDEAVLGMVVPAATPLTDQHSWAVIITRTDEGHVADTDAEKTDYNDLLKTMQQATLDQNEERRKAGFPEMTLVGWALPPRYDAANRKLYWARELAAAGDTQHTLNYDIRVLGRTGYISLNAIAGMNDVGIVQAGMQQLLPKVEFDPGKRYADFDASHDKLAAYGVAALVAGGIAAKAGLFAKLGVILLAAKKFIILVVAAVGAWVRKLFGGKDKNKPGPTVQ
jgi:uncharacterized membrane-anchored protein